MYRNIVHRRTPRRLRKAPPAGGRGQEAYQRAYTEYLQRFACRPPILLTSGRSDEVTPALMERARQLLPAAEWALFEDSRHMPHIEEPDRYRDAVDAFLNK